MASDNKKEKTADTKNEVKTSKTARQSNNSKKKTSSTAKSTAVKTTKKKTTGTKSETKSNNTKKGNSNRTNSKPSSKTKNTIKKQNISTTTTKKRTNNSSKVASKKEKQEAANSEKIEKKIITTIEEPEIIKELHVEEETEEIKKVEPEANNKKDAPFEVRSILGAKLPTGNNKIDRKARKRSYIKDAFIFATIIPILDLIAMLFIEQYKPFLITDVEWINYTVAVILDFILIFILTYVLDMIFGEEDVKKVNKNQ